MGAFLTYFLFVNIMGSWGPFCPTFNFHGVALT
ncbi:hypothetical protein T07_7174 [Trichinella nelsoni]|uniref:Uncharacterized protein n=1 Tax=Trichinella nelsoni TaxID=6336 RepID=A0A0V0RAA8_9BILA|nr:hypothetical protein T07_7174 [Trichinella nelsoni]